MNACNLDKMETFPIVNTTLHFPRENTRQSLLNPIPLIFCSRDCRMADQQKATVILPSYSAWFSLDSIHEIEQRSLPEFFDTDAPPTVAYKSPSTYKEYRDFMIHTYRLNPSEYLSMTTCRRHLVGDAGSILRVHSFLDQWGLINYQVANEASRLPPSLSHKPKIGFECPRGMVAFAKSVSDVSIANISQCGAAAVATSNDVGKSQYSLPRNADLHSTISAEHCTSSNASNAVGIKKQLYCNTCGVLLRISDGKGRYHCLKDSSIDICKGCYVEGRFSSNFYSGDFVHVVDASAESLSDESWTDEEVLLLLEGIEMYREDWEKVAQHVGTRSALQCIGQFLQLPIYESLSAGNEQMLNVAALHENPVIGVVTLLASLVHPKVAAAAAKAAIQEAELISRNDSKCQLDSHDQMQTDNNLETGNGEMSAPNNLDDISSTSVNVNIKNTELNAVAAVALAAGSVRAQQIIRAEHQSIQQLLYALIELVLKKIDLKLTQFDEIEKQLIQERKEIENQRNSVLIERIQLRKTAAAIQQQSVSNLTEPATEANTQQSNENSTDVDMSTNETGQITQIDNPTYTAL